MISEQEIQKRKRILVSLWAYAYEIMDDPMVSDEIFDQVCKEINPRILTSHIDLDMFFMEDFDPSTGMWVYKHPELAKLGALYQRLKNQPKSPADPLAAYL